MDIFRLLIINIITLFTATNARRSNFMRKFQAIFLRTLAGNVIRALKKSKTAVTVKPMSLKGSMSNQTRG